ncbi:hypothetical protein H8356DRAFT_1023974 [Neocallimastix lanati (nom. inval.)]|nr:hypothetical protein H8356DRAFT_1023974 [Neocallimastix sp. JGI-2020a]
MEYYFNRESSLYDLYFYDNIYTIRYSSKMLDLKQYLTKEHIDLYSAVVNSESYTYNGRLIGLPVSIDYAVLYSNTKYLEKYKKDIPKTWNELLETGKFIQEEEKVKRNNTDLIIYNGLFPLDEVGTCSIVESIHSYRDTPESPFPELTSQNAIDALEMMKTIKNEISSDGEYRSLTFPFVKLIDGEALFLKFCYLKKTSINPIYKISALPGKVKGVSSSATGGYNLGINKYSRKEKREQVIKAYTYLTSKEMQRKLVNNFRIISGISSLYDDSEEICKEDKDLCDLYKNLQPITRPISKTKDYTSYSDKLRDTIYQFLYGNKSAYEVLKIVDDITRIYYVTMDSSINLIITTTYIIISLMLLISLACLKFRKFKLYLDFLSNDFWVLFIIGIILIISISYLDLLKANTLICHLKLMFQSIGFTLMTVPILHKLIINFPESNKISQWIKNKKYLFLLTFIVVDVMLNSIIIFHQYNIKTLINKNEKNFQICRKNTTISSVQYILLIIHMLVILFSLFLTFLEWNIETTYYDIRFYISAVLIDAIIAVIYAILKTVNITNYTVYFSIRECIFMLFAISSYILMYGIKIIWALINKNNSTANFMRQVKDTSHTQNTSTSIYDRYAIVSNDSSSTEKVIGKIMKYHIQKSVKSESKLENQVTYGSNFNNGPSNSFGDVSSYHTSSNVSNVGSNYIGSTNVLL